MNVPAPVSHNHKPQNRKRMKRQVWERDRGICQLCAREIRPWQTSLDRVVPGAQGGRYALGNVQATCRPCNARKGDAAVPRFAYAPLDRLARLLAEGKVIMK